MAKHDSLAELVRLSPEIQRMVKLAALAENVLVCVQAAGLLPKRGRKPAPEPTPDDPTNQ